MRSLREVLQEAESSHTAVGHFNVSDTATLNAVASAARELGVPNDGDLQAAIRAPASTSSTSTPSCVSPGAEAS